MKKANWKKVFMAIMVCIAIACAFYLVWVVFSPKPTASTYYLNNGEETLIGTSTTTIAASSIVIPSIIIIACGTVAVFCGVSIKKEKKKIENEKNN